MARERKRFTFEHDVGVKHVEDADQVLSPAGYLIMHAAFVFEVLAKGRVNALGYDFENRLAPERSTLSHVNRTVESARERSYDCVFIDRCRSMGQGMSEGPPTGL